MSKNVKPSTVSKSLSVSPRTEADASCDRVYRPRKERCQETQYMFRAEFSGDADIVQTVLGRSLFSWQEDSRYAGLDTDVTFTIRQDGPSLKEMKWLIDRVVDCHVVSESLAPAAEYTGERVWLSKQYPKGLPTPPKRVVDAALEGLERYVEFLEAAMERAEDAIEAIRGG